MIKCPFCAFDNEDGALFCEQCKSDLSNISPAQLPQRDLTLRSVTSVAPTECEVCLAEVPVVTEPPTLPPPPTNEPPRPPQQLPIRDNNIL